jgi:peptide-methionine (S)-S-oxide reductase
MIKPEQALRGRFNEIVVSRPHLTLGTSMLEQPGGAQCAYFAMGCFWGAERKFYELAGVLTTAAGYQGGFTPNPTYEEVCTGKTGHAETVKVVFDPERVSYGELVRRFYESHDPTQVNRQGNDVGTQYRSAIFFVDAYQEAVARTFTEAYAAKLRDAGYGPIATEITPVGAFYMAEEYHQQYLAANPNGYCGLGGTGVSCPVGLAT